jgi:branched-chain amino acid aminotransferase
LNGNFVPEKAAAISIFDSALMYGDMVFEMTRSFNRRQFKLREHLERLYRSIRSLRIPFRMKIEEAEELVLEVVKRNQPFIDSDDEDRVMINVSRGPLSTYHPIFGGDPGPTLAISSFPLSLTLASIGHLYRTGVHAVVPSQRAIPACLLDPKNKNRSRLFYLMANLEVGLLKDDRAWALLLDPDGFVAEGSGANFFIVRNGVLRTPEPRNILCGVSRAYVMELATQMGIPVKECNLDRYEVLHSDEAFYTGTPFSILPCTRIDGVEIGSGSTGLVTTKLLQAWSAAVGVDIVAQAQRFAAKCPDDSRRGVSPYQVSSPGGSGGQHPKARAGRYN